MSAHGKRYKEARGAIDRDQLCAFFREQQRGRAADAASCASDDDGFAFEAAHEFLPDSYSLRRLPPCGIQTRFQTPKLLEAMSTLTYSDSEHY